MGGEAGMTELSAKGPVAVPRQAASGTTARRWAEGVVLAAAVGIVYFLGARLGMGLVLEPAGVAVFWPEFPQASLSRWDFAGRVGRSRSG
jgi:hypothetical protein